MYSRVISVNNGIIELVVSNSLFRFWIGCNGRPVLLHQEKGLPGQCKAKAWAIAAAISAREHNKFIKQQEMQEIQLELPLTWKGKGANWD